MQNACPKCGKAWDDHTWDGRTRIDVTCPSCQIQINTTGLLQLQAAGSRSEEPAPELPTAVQTASLDPGNRFGKYVRTKLLGEGGMGQVWMAWDTEISRWVALKIPKFDDATELARLKSEAQAAGKLSHPNVAAVYEFGQTQGRHFIAMEYVDGVTLGDYPRGDRKKLVAFVRQAALGVAYAHLHGIVHRDIKPVNIMVHREREQVYVMDFGIARQAASTKVSTSVVGTPAYMSPEQAQGEQVDKASDVWSLGVMLYELLTDRMPFEDVSPMGTLRKVVEEEARPLTHVDPDLNAIVLKCLEKDKSRRYVGAEELGQDLDRWLRGEAITARAPTVAYRLRKWINRRKTPAAVAGISLLIVLGFGSYAILSSFTHAAEKRKLEAEAEARQTSAELSRRSLEDIDEAKALWRLGTSKPEQWEGLFARANTQARGAVERSPGLPAGHFALGVIKHTEGQWQESIEELDRAARLDPSMARAWYYLGLCYLELYTRAILSPDLPDAAIFSPGLLDRNRSIRETDALKKVAAEPYKQRALETLRRFASLRRTEGEQDHEGRYAQAVLLFVDGRLTESNDACAALLTNAQTDEKVWLLKALIQMKQREYKPAIETLDKLLATVMPQFSRAYAERGKAKLLAVETDRAGVNAYLNGAIEDCSRAIQLEPLRKHAAAYVHRAIAEFQLAKYPEAIEDCTKAIEQDSRSPFGYLIRGFAKSRLADNTGALEDCARAVQQDSGDGITYQYSAALKEGFGEFNGAIADLTKAIERAPRAAFYSSRAIAKSENADPKGAIEDCTQAIATDPKHVVALSLRGSLRYMQGDQQGGLEDCIEAIEQDPRCPEAYLYRGFLRAIRKEWPQALEDYSEAFRLDPRNTRALLLRARVHLELRDHASVVTECSKALLIDPGEAEAYGCRASALASLGKKEQSLSDCAKARQLRPNHPQVLVYIGAARGILGDNEGAIKDYDTALRLYSQNYEALSERAALRIKVNDRVGAIQDWTKAIEINPGFEDAYLFRGLTRAHMEKPDREGAIQDYTKVIVINPRNADAYYNRGNSRVNLQKPDREGAVQDYTKAIEINPRYAEAYYFRGNTRIYLEKPDREGALQDYTKAIEINPGYVDAYYYRANLRSTLEKPDFPGAVQDYTKALELNPQFAEAYYYRANARGWSLEWKGDMKEVIADYVKALELAPIDSSLRKDAEGYLRTTEGRVRKYYDITHRLAAEVKGNRLKIVVSNALFGDPAFQVVKKLRVDYLERGKVRTKTVDENSTLEIVLDEGEKLIIKKALYGSLP